jgi:hypothetical protein
MKQYLFLSLVSLFVLSGHGYESAPISSDQIIQKLEKKVNKDKRSFLSKEEIATLALNEINQYSNNLYYSISNYYVTKDLLGNSFLYVNFNPFGYSVISMDSYETIEIDPFYDNSTKINNNDIYYPTLGVFKSNGNSLKNRKSGKRITGKKSLEELKTFSKKMKSSLDQQQKETINKKIEFLKSFKRANMFFENSPGNERKNWDIDIDSQTITATYEVPHSWFFKHNKYEFSYHDGGENGICEYIAYLLLAEYNDFFVAKGYFSEKEISKYVTTRQGINYINSIPNISDSFAYDLYIQNGKKESLNTGDLNSLSDMFLKGKNISYENVHQYWLFGNPINVIKSGRPDMLCGYFPDTGDRGNIGHNIVAYGYFDSGAYKGKYLTHYGWDNHTQCIVDRSVFRSGYDWSLRDKTTNPEKRYIFNINGSMNYGKDSD